MCKSSTSMIQKIWDTTLRTNWRETTSRRGPRGDWGWCSVMKGKADVKGKDSRRREQKSKLASTLQNWSELCMWLTCYLSSFQFLFCSTRQDAKEKRVELLRERTVYTEPSLVAILQVLSIYWFISIIHSLTYGMNTCCVQGTVLGRTFKTTGTNTCGLTIAVIWLWNSPQPRLIRKLSHSLLFQARVRTSETKKRRDIGLQSMCPNPQIKVTFSCCC